MDTELAYGRHGLNITLPETVDVLSPRFLPGLPDETEALQGALRNPIGSAPLAQLVKPGDRVGLVHTDITRAMPNERILPVLLDELETAGIARENITLINGLGTHRRQTEAELRSMLGERIMEGYRSIQHDCNDEANLVSLGETQQRPDFGCACEPGAICG